MEQYGIVLAGLHILGPGVEPDLNLLSQLADNESKLLEVHELISDEVKALEIRLEGDKLFIEPCLPDNWNSSKIHYRYRDTVYHISLTHLQEGNNIKIIILDGQESKKIFIKIIDDRVDHQVEVKLSG